MLSPIKPTLLNQRFSVLDPNIFMSSNKIIDLNSEAQFSPMATFNEQEFPQPSDRASLASNAEQITTLNTHLTFKGFEGKCLGFSGQVAKIQGGRGFFDMGRRA